MRLSPSLRPGEVASIAAIAVVFAALPFALLSGVARPAGFQARVAAAAAEADHAQRLAAMPGDPAAYPRGALCIDSADVAAQAVRQRIVAAAGAAGLAAPTIHAIPRRLDFEHGMPSVDLQVQASGRYDQMVLMLGRLSASRPQIFVDTLDLQPRVTAVTLKLSGHVFCRTPASS